MTTHDRVSVHAEAVMGTVVSFHVHRSSGDAEAGIRAACAKLHELDERFSLWNPSSPMSRVRAGTMVAGGEPAQLDEVLELCRLVVRWSDGWFDPWAMPGGLDPTGLIKGWAIEEAGVVLRAHGVDLACLNGGGDVALLGVPDTGSWTVGIRHPWRLDALAAQIRAVGAVATSGSYERGAHLIDPRTGLASTRAASATVVGPSLAIADGLATALAVGGVGMLELLESVPAYEGYLIEPDGTEHATGGMRFAELEVGAGAVRPTGMAN